MDAFQARLAFHNLCLYLRTNAADNFHIKLVAFDRLLCNLHIFSAFLLCQYVPTEGNILTDFAKRMTECAIDAFMFSIEDLTFRFPFDALHDFGDFNYNFVGVQEIFLNLLNDGVIPAMSLLRLVDELKWRKDHISAFILEKRYGPEMELR